MPIKDLNKPEFVIQKLGEAIYKHRRKARMAKEASQSVDYLASKGVFK